MFCLTVPTDAAWAEGALGDLDSLLVDHAHCEMKAASNALSLAARFPESHELVMALTDLAREEIDHFQEVTAWLAKREVPLGRPQKDAYAGALKRARSELPPTNLPPLLDELLVSALIEARSCERFRLLVDRLPEGDPLHAFYARLFACEAKHYATFLALATRVSRDEAVTRRRLGELARLEGAIVATLSENPPRATVHG